MDDGHFVLSKTARTLRMTTSEESGHNNHDDCRLEIPGWLTGNLIPMAPQGLSGKRGEDGLRASVLAGGGSFLVKVEIDKICFRGVFCEGLLN